MSKELEALKRIKRKLASHYDIDDEDDFNMIENVLELFDAIEKVPKVVDFNDEPISYVGHIIVIIDKERFDKDQLELKAFDVIREKEVNIHNFKKFIVQQDWTFEQYLDEVNDPNTDRHQFSYYRLIREEFDFLKEALKHESK